MTYCRQATRSEYEQQSATKQHINHLSWQPHTSAARSNSCILHDYILWEVKKQISYRHVPTCFVCKRKTNFWIWLCPRERFLEIFMTGIVPQQAMLRTSRSRNLWCKWLHSGHKNIICPTLITTHRCLLCQVSEYQNSQKSVCDCWT